LYSQSEIVRALSRHFAAVFDQLTEGSQQRLIADLKQLGMSMGDTGSWG
jgi:hypothetical protein